MNNILMLGILGVGAYYFLIKQDVLGIMSAGGEGETDIPAPTGAPGEMQPTGSPNPAVPGASIYPPDVGGYFKGIEYPNLSAVFPNNPGVGYRPPAFRTNEELIGGGFFGIPPGSGLLNPSMLPGQVLSVTTMIGGVPVPAGHVFVGTDPATGSLIFEEPDVDPTLPPDAMPGSVVVINETQPFVDIVTYVDKDGRNKEIKKKPNHACMICAKTRAPGQCRKCGRGGIKKKIKKKVKRKKIKIKKKKSHLATIRMV